MSYKATSYTMVQTAIVTAVGCIWLIAANQASSAPLLPNLPELAFGLIFGAAFYTFITIEELQALGKSGVAKVSTQSWLLLTAVVPTVFAVIYYFSATEPLKATALFFYTIMFFVISGGVARAFIFHRWEKTHGKL